MSKPNILDLYERISDTEMALNKLKAVQMDFGYANITPSAANTPTGVAITFSNSFSGTPYVVATPVTTVPGTTVLGVGCAEPSSTGFSLYVTRINTTATGVRWIAVY